MTPTELLWVPTCSVRLCSLIDPKAPLVGTGMEYQAAHDSGAAIIAQNDGKVVYSDADKVEVRREDGSLDVYNITKFRRSNSGTAYNQRTLVKVGDSVEKGDFIADGPSMEKGEMARSKPYRRIHDMGRLQL